MFCILKVAIYGKCGLPDDRKGDKFETFMADTFKFYLAFENGHCNQYITEKVFKRMDYNILPIVYGKANYSQILPPHSYIDIKDFASAKDLANYMLELNDNDEEYLSYFWWKDHYRVHHKGSDTMVRMLCQLCTKLHLPNLPEKRVEDLSDWWEKGSECFVGPDFKL